MINQEHRRPPRQAVEHPAVPDRFSVLCTHALARGATSIAFDPVNRCAALEVPGEVATVFLSEFILEHP